MAVTAKIKNICYFWLGIVFMLINKARHGILGYRTLRPFGIRDYDKCIRYDFDVVHGWLKAMDSLAQKPFSITGKNILEIGPGADLGVGLILLASGAGKYNALDINPLARKTPAEFYDCLFEKIRQEIPGVGIDGLKKELRLFYDGKKGRLNYVVDSSFSFSMLAEERIDVVLSQATFDALDNIEKTFSEITKIVKTGGYMLSTFELQTHTRWLRQKDPFNIYMYPDNVYRLLSFKGSPNRLRPEDYVATLDKLGWRDIRFMPSQIWCDDEINSTREHLYGSF